MSEKKRTGPQAHISEKRSRRKCPVKKQANMSGRLCCAQGLGMCLKNPENAISALLRHYGAANF